MDTFPPEIHSYICEFACLDDGRTSRALSLVSRYFREIAWPFLYRSVAVTGGRSRITTLTSQLEMLRSSQFRPICHLFLSDQQWKDETSCSGNITSPSRPPSSLLAGSSTALLARLISLAAPTLLSLSLVITNHTQSTPFFARLFRMHFPRLRELSLSGFYPFPASSSPSLLPALTHLHLHGNRNPHGLFHLDALSSTFCPSLTHLRISGLSMAVSFASELRTALTREPAEEQPDSPSVLSPMFQERLPSRVRHLTVQPGPEQLTKAGTELVPHLKERMMMGQLGLIQASVATIEDRSGVEFRLLRRSETASMHDTFRKDWEERLAGLEGCWSIPN